ncbi:MAG TPA: GAF domain-containing protein [Chloroflexota bacterium]
MSPDHRSSLPPLSYTQLIGDSADAILFADAEAHYVEANAGALALLGYTRAELVQLRVHDVVVEGQDWTDAEYDRFVKAGHWRGEVGLRRKDGSVVRAEARAVALDLPGGVLYASVLREGGHGIDRTEQLIAALSFDALTSSLDLDEALPALLEQVRELLGADMAAILLLDEDGCDLVLRASAGIPQQRGLRIGVGKGLVGRVAAAREPVVIDDFGSINISLRPEAIDMRSVAGVPVLSQDKLQGVLEVGSNTPRHFSDEDVALLRLAAERAGRTIERAALYAAERNAREAAERAATRLRLALGAGAIAIWEWDLDSGQISWSAELETLYGLGPGEMDGRPDAFLAHVHVDDRERLVAAVTSVDGDFADGLLEYRIIRPDGSVRWLAARGRLADEVDGRPRRIVAASMDVTDRKVADQARSRSVSHQVLIADLAQALAEAAPETSAVLDHFVRRVADALGDICTVRLLSADGAWLRTAAVHSHDRAIADELRAAMGAQQPADYGIAGRVITTGQTQHVRVANPADLRRDNIPELHPFLDRVSVTSYVALPLRSRGRVLGTVHLSRRPPAPAFTDDERLLLEPLVDRLALALDNASLFEAERRARREAELAVQTRDEFLSGVTHDLQNPLAVIQGQVGLFARRLARGEPPSVEQLNTGLDRISSTAARMSRQLQQLLDLARLELGQLLELRAEPVDLVPLLRRLVDELEPGQVQLEVAGPSLTGLFDPLRIERVFANLLDNAIKYSPAGESVVVRVSAEQRNRAGLAVVEIVDRGIGIPSDELPRVFQRFFRASNTAGKINGSGIGLATADQIVRQHGGTITASSQPGRGSTFRVELPLQ